MKPYKIYFSIIVALLPLLFLSCGKELFTGKREARGVWMSRFEYANEQTRNNPEASKEKIRAVFEKARAAKFNMILFQVRGNADAFYRSDYEPWAETLTGTLGQDPGWDPLQFAIEEAHRLGLELHVWMNTFPIWRGAKLPPETTPRPLMLEHPEWIVCDSSGKRMHVDPPNNDYIWASPGIPAVRQHIINVAMNIVEKYDVDGIHFDYIRYPEGSTARGYSHDSISVARFNSVEANPNKLSWDHWQREQVNQFVFDAYNSITAKKPWVKTSASVIGKYMGSGWTSYYAVYQDPRRWMEIGKIDFIVPMVYWQREHPTHPFVPLITQWHDRVAYDRHVVPGLYTALQRKFGWSELEAEILEIRKRGLPGVVFFSANGLTQAWGTLGTEEFPYWANVPRMMWKDSIPPAPPATIEATTHDGHVVLRWTAANDEPLTFNIYRSKTPAVSRDDVKQLLFVTGRNILEFTDTAPLDGDNYYAVTALDRLGNESEFSTVVRVQSGKIALMDNEASGMVAAKQ